MHKVVVSEHDSNDDLSEEQIAFINESIGRCPFCTLGLLRAGPAGGESRNFRCHGCRREVNLHLSMRTGPAVVGGHIIHRDEPSLYSTETLMSILTRS